MRPFPTRDGRAPSPAPTQPPAPPKPKALALLDLLERQVGAELGTLREGAQPLLDEVRQGLVVLEPPGDGMLPSPQEQEKLRAKLSATLEEAEDVLEALQLAARASGQGSS
ncbi:hypothetical protein [Corallococcus sp. CA053C]|uniref:hypothetical protein n=1 Tax=Corallococcus sp. CA053C TaxID=2316732 RepID=UPI001F192024|nr:hypothetical protein [Corallococcus sp. CA053C]